MTLLNNKHMALVGDENSLSDTLAHELKSLGAKTSLLTCNELTPELVNDKKIDLIILNHLDKCEICPELLKKLKGDDLSTPVPVFSVVQNDKASIEKALAEGSADYITTDEPIKSVISKIEAVMSEDKLFSGSAIDITDDEAPVSLTGIRVFVVEDDPLLRNLLATKFNRSNFPHEFSKDGDNVAQAMQQFKPDILVLDLMLPGRSGFDVLDEIRVVPELKDIPVIIFSNKDSVADKERAHTYYGIDNFYIKAMTDLSELVKTIELVVKSK